MKYETQVCAESREGMRGMANVLRMTVLSNQMQVTQGQGLIMVCATCNWFLHPAPTSANDGLDPLQLALLMFSMPTGNWPIYVLMCANILACFVSCTVLWWWLYVYMYVCVRAYVCVCVCLCVCMWCQWCTRD